jgi:pilus assembly protein CpaF
VERVCLLEGIIESDQQLAGKIQMNDPINDISGLGPIFPLLLDEDVSEVMVNGPKQVYCERKGKLMLTPVQFRDNEHVMTVIDKIVESLGRTIDESSPILDARLPDGSHVNAIIPPLALNEPTITIRKSLKDPYQIEDLINFGTVNKEIAIFLDACVKARLNMFVSGGAGFGKTTTLNVLSNFIPEGEKIVMIEDAAELQLGQAVDVISLETKQATIEGKGNESNRDLVRNALQMSPDRLIIGEVRGGEALDMLQAMNSGHDGLLATGHSKSPRDMIARLETMVLLAGVDLPIKAIREQIAGGIDVIIQQTRLKDGTRKIVNITEIQGMEGENIVLKDIFSFKQEGLNSNGKIIGRFVPTGVQPNFYNRLEAAGVHIPASLFLEN